MNTTTKTLKNSFVNVEFITDTANKITVLVYGASYGYLEYDKEQKQWVLWSNSFDNGISYYNDLNLTEEEIFNELTQNSKDELNDLASF